MEKLNLEYLTPNSARCYDFYLIPKELITNPVFDEISHSAKLLYALLLNRASLSAVNSADFTDKAGHLYVIYTVEQIMADMRCTNKPVINMLKQLDDIGLIKKRRQGQGKPSIIYVKDFSTVQFKTCTKYTSASIQYTPADIQSTVAEVYNVQCSNHNLSNPKKNHNDRINNDLIIQQNSPKYNPDRQAYDMNDMKDIDSIKKAVKYTIELDSLLHRYPAKQKELQELYEIIVEVLASHKPVLRIAKEDMPADVVKQAFASLNYNHIEYVLDCLAKNTSEVKSIKSYLQTSLFNASKTMNNHTCLEVQSDFGDI